jgi:hypothetical protein
VIRTFFNKIIGRLQPGMSSKNYFEIGRGARLTPMGYWHQYVLGIDLAEKSDLFVVSEIGKDKVEYEKQISFEDIVKEQWNEFLELSGTKEFISELKADYIDNAKLKSYLKETVDECNTVVQTLNGNWISIEDHDDLDYNSNFGNWVDASPVKGKLKFSLDLRSNDKRNCRVDIPVNYWTMSSGYYSIIYGRFQMSRNQLLIWENNVFPHQIKYSKTGVVLTLELFKSNVRFRRE